MTGFWKWMTRANARAVFLCSVVVFVLVTAGWIWRGLFPPSVGTYPLTSPPKEEPAADLGILSFLDEQAAIRKDAHWGDPFFNAVSAARITVPSPAPVTTQNPQPKPVPPPAAEPVPTPPPRKTVRLVYHGMIVKPDGRTVALIRDEGTGRTRALSSGSRLDGLGVGAIAMDKVEIVTGSNSTATLTIGKPQSFPEDGDGR